LFWVVYYMGGLQFWCICFHCEVCTSLGYQWYLEQWLGAGLVSLGIIGGVLELFIMYLWAFVLFCASCCVFTFVCQSCCCPHVHAPATSALLCKVSINMEAAGRNEIIYFFILLTTKFPFDMNHLQWLHLYFLRMGAHGVAIVKVAKGGWAIHWMCVLPSCIHPPFP